MNRPKRKSSASGRFTFSRNADSAQPVHLPAQLATPNLFAGLVVRAAGDPLVMIAAVREAMRSVDPEQAVLETSVMEQRIADSVARSRLQMILLGAFGFLALVLAYRNLWCSRRFAAHA
jgi:hypothetical protein